MNDMQITYFLTVAECESFSRAADKLFVSQPAVSKQIRSLEEEWGITLFSRKRRMAVLTSAGKCMLEHIRLSHIALDNALHHAQELELAENRRFFSIGLFEHCNLDCLPTIFSAYAEEHADVSIDFENTNFFSLNENLFSRKYDVILTFDRFLQRRQAVKTLPLTMAQHIAYISRQHALAKKPNLCFGDLKELCFYVPTFQSNDMTCNSAKYICMAQGITPACFKLVPNVESALLAVRMGKGAVILDNRVSINKPDDLLPIVTDVFATVVFAWLADRESALTNDFVRYAVRCARETMKKDTEADVVPL